MILREFFQTQKWARGVMAAQREIRALTGIRGVAACFVVVYHYLQSAITGGVKATFLHHGYLAVDLFFVLSGFVMMMSYEPRFRSSFNVSKYIDFLYKRFGRIYPLYAVVTILFTGAIYWHAIHTHQPSISEIVLNLLLVHGWGMAGSIGGPTWSISTEFAAYLLFPALVYYTSKDNRYVRMLLCVAAVLVLFSIGTLSTQQVGEIYDGVVMRNGPLDIYDTTTPYALFRCLAGFTLGVVSFRLSEMPWVVSLRHKRFSCDIVMAAVLIGLALPSSDVVVVVLFILLVNFLAEGKSITSSILATAPIYWLGTISYSIYLVHMFLSGMFRSQLSDLLSHLHINHGWKIAGVLLLPIVIAVSAVTYYFIERPARDGLRNLASRRMTPIAVEPSAP